MIAVPFKVWRDGEEIELTVKGRVTPYIPAIFRGHPDNWAPAEGGEAKIDGVLLGDDPWDGELVDDEVEQAEAALQDAADDEHETRLRDQEEARGEASAEREWEDG